MKFSTVLFVCSEVLRNTSEFHHNSVLTAMLDVFEGEGVIDSDQRGRIDEAIADNDDVALDGLIELLGESE